MLKEEECVGKTVQSVNNNYSNLVIKFTDGTFLGLVPREFYGDLSIEYIDDRSKCIEKFGVSAFTEEEVDAYYSERRERQERRERAEYERMFQKFGPLKKEDLTKQGSLLKQASINKAIE